MKTIREISELINVSKVTLHKAIKNDEFKSCIVKQGNTTYIDDVGVELLIELFKDNDKIRTSNVKINKAESEEILFLRKQVESLTNQNETLINDLSKANDKVASLADDLIKLNENSQILLREQNLKSLPEPTPEKVGFWKRVFKKKNGQ